MEFATKFSIGDRVRRAASTKSQAAAMLRRRTDPAFTIGQVRIQTIKGGGLLVEYRANYSTGRNGPWIAEFKLKVAERPQSTDGAG